MGLLSTVAVSKDLGCGAGALPDLQVFYYAVSFVLARLSLVVCPDFLAIQRIWLPADE